MLKQTLQQKLGLKINPMQIQLIKLLEIPSYQLDERIKEELEQNPLLEEGSAEDSDNTEISSLNDDSADNSNEDYEDADLPADRDDEEFTMDDYMSADDYDDVPEYKLKTSNISKDNDTRDFIVTEGDTFRDSLMRQLGMRNLSDFDKKIAEYIVGNIDNDGYLRRGIDNIVDDLAFNAGIEVEEEKVSSLLNMIQKMEPAGVGARNLRECLLLQINAKLLLTPNNKVLKLANSILSECFDEFSKKHYEKISRKLKISEDELKSAIEDILKLNPKPGSSSADNSFGMGAEKIIPDFTLELQDGELQLSLNKGSVPSLRINKSYINLLDSYKKNENSKNKKDVVSFVKYKLSAAKSFIDALEQRNNTLMLTMTAIIQLQKRYFMTGDENKLKPMILKDVADITGLDVSTISRVSNSKHIQTWFGVFALKDFFSGTMQTTSGTDVSTNKLKNMLRKIINNEDKSKPYTDDELVNKMTENGFVIARRTVAKYRKMMNLPVARMRREI